MSREERQVGEGKSKQNFFTSLPSRSSRDTQLNFQLSTSNLQPLNFRVSEIWIYLIVALGAYLLGSIPFGYLVARAKGIDIRNVGSGNIGATNAMRVLGKPAGIFVLLMDAAKGWLACILGIFICAYYFSPPISVLGNTPVDSNAQNDAFFALVENGAIIAGIFAVLGHNYTCWLKFKGGKGIATTAGVFLALAPWALLVAFIVFILAVALTKYVSVGSIAAAIALPATVWIMAPHNLFLNIVTISLGVLAIWKHKANIKRLLAGTENRIGQKKVAAQAAEKSEGAK